MLMVDTASHKRNLIIAGVKEVDRENSEILCVYLFDLFSQNIDTLELSDFYFAYRLANQNTNCKYCRPILVTFTKESTRNLIADTQSRLGDDESLAAVYLNDALPKEVNDRRFERRMILKLAREQKIPAKISGGWICVNNIWIVYHLADDFTGIMAFQSQYSYVTYPPISS